MSVDHGPGHRVGSSPHDSSRRFELVLDALLEGCQIFDHDWRCLYVNETAAKHTHQSRERLLGKTITEIYWKIEETRLFETLRSCMQERKAAHVEAELASSGSSVEWFDLSCSPVPEGLLVLTSEISNRKRVEELLKTSEARFRSLVEQAAEAMFVHDFDGRFVEVNQQACRSLGYTREELLRMNVTDLEQDFDLSAAQAAWSKIEKDQPFTLLGHQRRKDGTVFPVEVRFGRFDAGVERFFLGLVRDISERKEAELKQKHLTDVLRAIRNVNQLIVHEKEPKELLRRACDLLTETRGYDTAWAALRDDAGRLKAVAKSKFPDGDAFERMRAQIENGKLPLCCLRAATQPDVVVVHDLSRDCDGCALAGASSGTAVLSMAIRASGRDYGVLIAALPPTMAGDAQEQSLFGEVVGDIGFALEAIEAERKRQQTAEGLAKSEERLKAALASMTDAVFISDMNGNFVDFNDAFATFHKFKSKEECAKTLAEYPAFLDVFLPNGELAPLDQWAVPRALKGETVTNAEYSLRRKDTGETWVGSYCFAPIVDESGAIVGSVVVGRDITDRKREEKALRESEERFAKIFGASPVGITIFGFKDKRFRDVNEGFLKILGYSRDEVVGRTATELSMFVGSEERDAWARQIREGHAVLNQDAKIRHKSGEIRHVLASVDMIDVSGERMGLMMISDITDRDKAVEALRESEDRYHAIFEQAGDGVFIMEPAGRIVSVNGTFAEMHGLSVEEMLRMGLAGLDVEGEAPMPQRAQRLLAGETLHFEVEHRHKDGHIFPLAVTANLINVGRDQFILAVHRDISEQRRAAAALEDMRYILSEGQKLAHLGTFEYTAASQTVIWSEEEYRIYGLDPSGPPPTYEQMLTKFVHQDDATLVDQAFTNAIQHGSNYELEYRIVRPDGAVRWVYNRAKPYLDQHDKLARFIGSTLDITERKLAEEEKSSLSAQLQQAQKMESIGRLAGGVAHDFNNILTVQRGYCEILKHGLKGDDPLAKGLAQIDECAERAAALTRQLLAFSRKQTLQPQILDMNVLVNNLDRMLRRLIGEDIDLSISSSATPGMIKADPGQIEQVIINLAVNARDAMPQGGKLSIQVAEVELDETYSALHVDTVPGSYVMLAMSDTGTGMDAETKGRIFEPFFTTKGEGKGTGLGLSTVYGIVRQSGGSVWVYTELGKGSTFKVYLPLVQAEATKLVRDETTVERGLGELILVVEDEQPLRELAKLIVEDLGYEATVAANGGEALILVEEKGLKPDIILTDVVMPGMSGRVLVERLRKTVPNVKVIYMSGYTDDAVVRHGVLESEINFLQKPFTVSALAAKLKSTLKKE